MRYYAYIVQYIDSFTGRRRIEVSRKISSKISSLIDRSAKMRTAKFCFYVLLITAVLNTFAQSTALTQNPNSGDSRYSRTGNPTTPNNMGTSNSGTVEAAKHPQMKEDADGELIPGEYTVISPNGSITRALCPYTCDMRGLPKNSCKSWRSKSDSTQCYLQDTRIPSSAVE